MYLRSLIKMFQPEDPQHAIQGEQYMSDVSVIGLGPMGIALARALLSNGYRVTVWNRTISKAEPLVREGAVLAPNVAFVVGASPVVIVCLHDYEIAYSILETEEVIPI